MRDKRSCCIVITGNIAAGKTHASAFFKNLGFEIIDADKIGHLALERMREEVIALFGSAILESGVISRKKLGEIVFANIEKLRALEAITHPFIKKEVTRRIEQLEGRGDFFFLDMPIFFEVQGQDFYPHREILLITAPDELREARLLKRNPSLEQAKDRMRAQIKQSEKVQKSDVVIENSGTLAEFEAKLQDFLESLKKR